MNFAELEKLRIQVSSMASRLSGMPKIILYNFFYSNLLACDKKLLIEAYALEFISDYCNSLLNFSPFYSDPTQTDEILLLLNNLLTLPNLVGYRNELERIIGITNEKLNHFKSILRNEISIENEYGDLSFPLIGKIEINNFTLSYSSLEKLKIKISPAKEKDSFVFVPSVYNNGQLQEQAEISLELAKNLIKEYKHRISKYHEVLIYFENLSAEYNGKSFGVALTIGLIEQLSLYYNLPYIAKIKEKIASTGGIDNNGNVLPVGNEAVTKKVESIFYSDIKTFVIAKKDEQQAKQTLLELNFRYPERKLRLVSIETLSDLLERRNLIGLKKQHKIVRTARGIKKHWLPSLLFLLITLILIFIYIRDYDENPTIAWYEKDTFFFANKSKRILFTKKIDSTIPSDGRFPVRYYVCLTDINNDGINEVILTHESNSLIQNEHKFLACLDNKGNKIWTYQLQDSVYSEREDLYPPYDYQLIDTLTLSGEKLLYFIANNRYSYPGAVISIDIKTGKPVGNVLWNSGHFSDGIFIENSMGKKRLFTSGINNGLGRASFLILKPDSLFGQIPTRKDYLLKNIPVANYESYYLLPKTDLCNMNEKYNLISIIQHSKNDAVLSICTNETSFPDPACGIWYNYNYRKNTFSIFFSDKFSMIRDKYVKIGLLNPPFTDTRKYRDMLESQLVYLNGEKFAKR